MKGNHVQEILLNEILIINICCENDASSHLYLYDSTLMAVCQSRHSCRVPMGAITGNGNHFNSFKSNLATYLDP